MDLVVRVIFEKSVGDLSQTETLLGLHDQAHNPHAVDDDGPHLVLLHVGELELLHGGVLVQRVGVGHLRTGASEEEILGSRESGDGCVRGTLSLRSLVLEYIEIPLL